MALKICQMVPVGNHKLIYQSQKSSGLSRNSHQKIHISCENQGTSSLKSVSVYISRVVFVVINVIRNFMNHNKKQQTINKLLKNVVSGIMIKNFSLFWKYLKKILIFNLRK